MNPILQAKNIHAQFDSDKNIAAVGKFAKGAEVANLAELDPQLRAELGSIETNG